MKDRTAGAPSGSDSAPRASTRLVQREPIDRVVAIGLRDPWLGDLYHHLLVLPWWAFLLGLAAVYLGLNILFAVLYLLGDAAIANARPGAFSDAFFFSVETISTIGYGQMSPATLYGNIVMTVEAMFGLILLAASAGVVLARFSRPTARVMFSKVAVVAPYDGVPTLSFRLANERRNQILEAQVSVTLVRDERTAEGEWMRRFYDLQLARQAQPDFCNDVHGDAPDRCGEPVIVRDGFVLGSGSCGDRRDRHRSRRDYVPGGPRSHLLSRTRGAVGPSFRRCVHPDQRRPLGYRLSPVPRH